MLSVRRGLFYALAGASLLCACADEEPSSLGKDKSEIEEESDDDSSDDDVDVDDDAPSNVKDAGKKDAGPAKDTTPAKDGGSKDAAAPVGSTDKVSGNVPCDVAKIVADKCLACHGEEKAAGVEFSLTKLEDFHQPAVTDEAKKIHEVANTRVNAPTKKMPPASVKALTADELKTLTDWLGGGAKGSTEKCSSAAPVDTTGEFATPGSGGAQIKPIKYDDPNLKCYPFTSYGKSDRKGKYSVPTNPDYYVAFTMKAPWQGTQYIRSFKGIIDNKDVIHHWLFFRNLAGGTDGSITENALGANPDAEMLFGWAPGGDDMYMDPDVGMAVSGNDTFRLEAHYNNKKGAPSPDASGVEVCVTTTKPEHVAGLTWIGTDAIAGTSATGQCNSTHDVPVKIFSAQPHMHTKGKHMKVTVNRKGGMKEVIHDEDFDFEYQRSYILDVTLQPGDTMTTTCDYTSSAVFGKGTNDEMCYFFSNSWPVGELTMLGIGTVIHGPNSCL